MEFLDWIGERIAQKGNKANLIHAQHTTRPAGAQQQEEALHFLFLFTPLLPSTVVILLFFSTLLLSPLY
jgi:hypothetical protein